MLRCELEAPFRVRVEDGAAVTVVAPVRGTVRISHAEVPQVMVGPGEVAVVPDLDGYVVTPSEAGTSPVVRILPGGHCADEQGRDLSASMWLDSRVWGTRLGGSHAFVTASYQAPEQVGDLLVRVLDEIVVAGVSPQLLSLLTEELADDRPGQGAALDRLVDLLLVSALRAWFAEPSRSAPVGWHAQGDPVIGPVLDLIHRWPAERWTVAGLAHRVGWSRATVARRFTELVGEPPITYLVRWRMTLAADALRRTDGPVARVGRDVGYDNPYAFSSAFRRFHGVSPRGYRAGGDGPGATATT